MKRKQSGYIIREEEILKGDDSSNRITQIVTEGTRVGANEPVFRYYSANEEAITKQIENLDIQIDKALSEEENIGSSLEIEIKKELENMFKENNLQNIREYQKRINNYIVKKSEIAGSLSSEGSYVRTLIEQRTALNNQISRKFKNNK